MPTAASIRKRMTAGRCPVHVTGCRKGSLPICFEDVQRTGEIPEWCRGMYERHMSCVTNQSFVRRVEKMRAGRPETRLITSCLETGDCVRPERWIEWPNGEVHVVVPSRAEYPDDLIHQNLRGHRLKANGHVLQCVFCRSTRGEMRRAKEQAYWDAECDEDDEDMVGWCQRGGRDRTEEEEAVRVASLPSMQERIRANFLEQYARRWNYGQAQRASRDDPSMDAAPVRDFVMPPATRVDDCPICTEPNPLVVADCNHAYCVLCTRQLVDRSLKCPMCRREMTWLVEREVESAGAEDKAKEVQNESVSESEDEVVGLVAEVIAKRAEKGKGREEDAEPWVRLLGMGFGHPERHLVASQWMAAHLRCPKSRPYAHGPRPIVDQRVIRPVLTFGEIQPQVRRRGERGGRRLREKKRREQPGMCHLQLFRRQDRDAAALALGSFPTVGAIATTSYKPTGLPKALVRHHRGMHVEVRPGWDMVEQVRWLRHNDPQVRVGATLMEFAEADLEEDITPLLDDPFINMWLDAYDQAQSAVEQTGTINEPICVKGGGDCWKRLGWPIVGEIQFEDPKNVKVSEILPHLTSEGKSWVPLIELERQEDGDWHIGQVHWTNSMRFRMMEDQLRKHFPTRKTLEEVADAFREVGEWREKKLDDSAIGGFRDPVLVGKAANGALDDALLSLTNPEIQRTAQNLRLEQVTRANLEVNDICPWAVRVENQDLMNELRLPWSKTSALTHTHEIHAAVRRWELKRAVPKLITADTTVVSTTAANLAMLHNAVNGGPDAERFRLIPVNPVLDLKDLGRYRDNLDSIPTQVFELPEIETPMVYFFNSGHYLREGGLLHFFKSNPKVHTAIISSIYPVDALVTNTSTRPTLYQWTVEGDRMVYIPEGDVGGRYEQPADPGLLMLKRIESVDGKLSLQGGIVESKLNTHIQVWTRFNLTTYDFMPLAIPTMMKIPRVLRSAQHCEGLIRVDDYLKMVQYGRTLVNAREVDYWAKLRLFTKERAPYLSHSDECHLVQAVSIVAKITLTPDLQSKFYDNLGEEVWYKTVGHLIRIKDRLFAHRYAKRAAKIVNNPPPIQLFPLAVATVAPQKDGFYNLKWKFDPVSRDWIMASLVNWGRRLLGVPRVVQDDYFSIAVDGTLVMDKFICRTARTIRAHGVDLVYASQANAFWRMHDATRLTREIQHEVEGPRPANRYVEDTPKGFKDRESEWARVMNTPSVDTLPVYSKPPSYKDWSQTSTVHSVFPKGNTNPFVDLALRQQRPAESEFSYSESLKWLENEEPEELPPLDASLDARGYEKWKKTSIRSWVINHDIAKVEKCGWCNRRVLYVHKEEGNCGDECAVCHPARCVLYLRAQEQEVEEPHQLTLDNHCAECEPWQQWRFRVMDDYQMYLDACEMDHNLKTFYGESEAYEYWKQKAEADAKGREQELNVPKSFPDQVSTLVPQISQAQRAKPLAAPKDDPRAHEELIRHRAKELQTKPQFEELKEIMQDKYSERWKKMSKQLPYPGKTVFNFKRKELWDVMFKLSVDKRVKDVPFENASVYPSVEYPQEDCMLQALEEMTGADRCEILAQLVRLFPRGYTDSASMLPLDCLHTYGCAKNLAIRVVDHNGMLMGVYGIRPDCAAAVIQLSYRDNHLKATRFRPALTIGKSIKPHVKQMPPGWEKMINQISAIPYIQWRRWTPEGSRGALFVRAMMERTTGLIGSNPLNEPMLKSWEASCDMVSKLPSDRMIAVVEGDPGCRKSSAIQKILSNKEFHRSNLFSVNMATGVLAGDWKSKLDVRSKDKRTGKGSPASTVVTYEKALTEGHFGFLEVFDEDKYPKGYMPLFATVNPHVKNFIILGDRYQSARHEIDPDCLLNAPEIAGNMEFYAQYSPGFLKGTYRMGPDKANFFRMPTFVDNKPGFDGFYFTDTEILHWQGLKAFFPKMSDDQLQKVFIERNVYTAAFDKSRVVASMMQFDAITFAGSQGLSSDLDIIVVDEAAILFIDPRIWYTVLTRSRATIIWCQHRDHNRVTQAIEANPILRELYWYRGRSLDCRPAQIHPAHTIDMEALCGKLNVKKILHGRPDRVKNIEFVAPYLDFDWKNDWLDPDDPLPRAGAARLSRESEEYRDAPQFSVNIEEWQHYRPDVYQAVEAVARAVKQRTHMPPVEIEHLDERHHQQMLERFDAELTWKGLFSSQKPDQFMWRKDQYEMARKMKEKLWPKLSRKMRQRKWEEMLRGLPDYEHPLKFDPKILNWGQYQTSFDAPSFAAGIAQRMRFATREQNEAEYREHNEFGLALWAKLKNYLGWTMKVAFDPVEFEDCIIEFQERRQARSAALKKASLNRSDPDYQTVLTAKTQWKMKDRDFPIAKPLQTIMVRSDEYLFRFGPIGVYLLRKLLQHSPNYCYWHAKKTMADLQAWSAIWEDHEDFEILDIKGFDGTVRGEGVVLMEQLMLHFSIATEHVEAYHEDKVNLHTRTLAIALMTISGEAFTWLGNSIKSAALEVMKYDMQPGHPMKISGDDVQRRGGLVRSAEYVHNWQKYDAAEEKRATGPKGEFCTVVTTRGICYKDPIVLYKRLRGHLSSGNTDNIALGYFDLFAMNYQLGDRCFDVMDEEELEHAAAINRIMFNIRKYGYSKPLPWDKLDIAEYETPRLSMQQENQVIKALSDLFSVDVLSQPLTALDPYTGYVVDFES